MNSTKAEYLNKIILGDALTQLDALPDDCIDLAITSPPYFGCRIYGNETLGREEHPLDYVKSLLEFTDRIKRVLSPTGSFYLNIGDIYFGNKGFIRNKGTRARKTDTHYREHKVAKQDGKYLQYKQLLMLPERVAIGMQEQGWILRNKVIWEKPNPIPTYSPDRRYPVYEYIFHFVRSRKYYFNLDLAKTKGHHRDVIRSGIEPFGKHQASYPLSLITPFIETTSKPNDLVLDPFMGSGTTAVACIHLGRNYLGFEINPEYCEHANNRIALVKDSLSDNKDKVKKVRRSLKIQKKVPGKRIVLVKDSLSDNKDEVEKVRRSLKIQKKIPGKRIVLVKDSLSDNKDKVKKIRHSSKSQKKMLVQSG